MKVYLPLMVQDPMTAPFPSAKADKVFEGIHVNTEEDHVDEFADGPATSSVIVEDFDASGRLLPPVRFSPPGRGRKMGRYETSNDIYSHEFIRTSVLGAVMKTMRLFSQESALGREIKWACPGGQLRVLPRAGEGTNAFYERESGTLQFFYFKNPHDPSQTVYTSLSRDIVAHETGHALIDAIAPGLYDALTPQALAVHEALADITALLTAFQSNSLRLRVLERTRGSIRNPTEFTSLAPEFARALDKSGHAGALRSLWNKKTLDPSDKSKDKNGRPNFVDSTDPHALSEVLSGALYRVMVQMQERCWENYGGDFSSSGRALAEAVTFFQRAIFRAIDNLPPGEASFADYGRAFTTELTGSFVGRRQESHWLEEELRRRHVIRKKGEIQKLEPEKDSSVKMPDVQRLIEDDAEALAFVKKYRSLFKIPPRVPFTIHPRHQTCKTSGWGKKWDETSAEWGMLLKVSWEQIEEDSFDRKFPSARSVTCGSTVELSTEGGVREVFSNDVDAQKPERDRMIRSLHEKGLLQLPDQASRSRNSKTPIRINVRNGIMKIQGAGQLLHFQRAT